MTHLRPPGLGPIIGHTTATSTRLWIRGDDDSDERTIGVAALFLKNNKRPVSIRYFRLRREYDRTGCVDFTDLEADSQYRAIFGTLTMQTQDPHEVMQTEELFKLLPEPKVWLDELRALPEESSVARFATMKAEAGGSLSFLFGSCRYPGIFAQQSKLGDRIFRAVADHIYTDAGPARFFLMIGDQIYADLWGRHQAILRADTFEEFQERYRSAFETPNLRKLMQSLPTYMLLDDHEIEDNWHQSRIHIPEKRLLFNTAIAAYRSYQWLHSPRNFGDRLYYSFECQGYPFFALDVRTQRISVEKKFEDNHLLGYPAKDSPYPRKPDESAFPKYPGQIDQLCRWLIEAQETHGNRPKFIVSPGVFVPNTVENVHDPRAGDSWSAFPATRRTLLATIVENNIQNVVFLCGDVHCSIVAEMSFHSKGEVLPIKAYSITSSAFYWPFPFSDGDPNTFVHNSALEDDDFEFGDCTMRYTCSLFEQEDNFTRIDVDETALTVSVIDRKGELRSKHPDGDYSAQLVF
ncbi:MAG: alkaline phosphatase family protein [bacterium]|nr:alkaline phosphatase family protein [bacterium]